MVDVVVLKGPVGAFIPARQVPLLNDFGDQALVTTMLYAIGPGEGGSFGELLPLLTHRAASQTLAERIRAFQEFWPGLLSGEDRGVVRPASPTLRQLIKLSPAHLAKKETHGDYEIEITPEGVGDGHQAGSIPVAEPNSLFSGGPLMLISIPYKTTIRLVRVNRGAARFWFGIAIPDGCTSFDKALVFFHPTAKSLSYPDADYHDFTGNWRYLHRNNIRPVAQQAAAALKVPLIVPYMRNAAADASASNPFSHDAAGMLNAVLMACLRAARPGDLGVPKASAISVVSFSAGINYLVASLSGLRATGTLREAIDLDSPLIVTNAKRLMPGAAPRTVLITQVQPKWTFPGAIVRAAPWWGEHTDDNGLFQTHQRIFNQALYPALTRSALR